MKKYYDEIISTASLAYIFKTDVIFYNQNTHALTVHVPVCIHDSTQWLCCQILLEK